MNPHSFHIQRTSTPSSKLKLRCGSESTSNACSDTKTAECVLVPISVKPEPDLDPYFLSLELLSRESTTHPDDHKVKVDLLDLKSEIKSELSSDELLCFEVADMIGDPFKDCVKLVNEQVNNCSIPEHSEGSLVALQKDKLQHPTPQVEEDHSSTEVLLLAEPEGLNQEGRVCHLLRYRTQVNNRHVKQQHSEKETCEGTKRETYKARRKRGNLKQYMCSLCGKILANCNGLQVHMRIHTGEKPYVCPTCGKAFARSDWLKDHMMIHTGLQKLIKPHQFQCSQCDKSFAKASGLQYHMRRHTRERPYACHLCEKRFIDVSDLNQHAVCHSNIRPFVCTDCGSSFQRRCTLEKHQRIHTGEKPYKCPECGKAFPYKYSFTVHLRTHKKLPTIHRDGLNQQ
ncbi:hypothetical protein AALO_G00233010 [Alosa alosa]|uniref:C2H2-type domain-containing protein n=1 Tax=Alosa alosa TaxID=278164 RepID=A0AAV6FUL4_9TELE|nr:zinc finger protein 37 homolog [Alosa alosa]XP_048124869.1 zinc finger protein 37 homolog [Alosa alosa]XP_048124870.1 zinc finger protein 37 homolog [Alosa alosa]KAG5266519.1 hypothetical protein AALO_G00233010 [Alosa alosa]